MRCKLLMILIGLFAAAAACAQGKVFDKAISPLAFSFPADHAAHPAYRTEWWYYTGSLKDQGGRQFGYQLTFFRVAVTPEMLGRTSKWASREVMLAHFAITDVASGKFFFKEKVGRPVLKMSGYSTKQLAVFIADWSASQSAEAMRLKAVEGNNAIDLTLKQQRQPMANGDRGLSRKGPGAGNANYYYSITRLATSGTLKVGGKSFQVSGFSWMDHEWGTSELSPNQKGWDWFSLRLSDGRDLMLYSLRDSSGKPTSYSSGMIMQKDGSTKRLLPKDFSIRPISHWTSSKTRAKYPSVVRLEVPSEKIRLEVRPRLSDQEMRTTEITNVIYWEGLVSASGSSGGAAVTGEGYVELTGYAPGSAGFGFGLR